MHKIKKIAEQDEKISNIPLEVAQKIIVEAQQKKIAECNAELQKVLDKFGFRLEVRNQILLLPRQQ